MTDENPEASWFDQAQKNWTFLAQGAVWIMGIVGGFLLPPPIGADDPQSRTWVKFAQFVVAASFGLVLMLARRWNRREHAKAWWLAAILFLAVSIVAFFAYEHLTNTLTCNYRGGQVIMGSEYTPSAQDEVTNNPQIPCAELMADFAGEIEDVWTKKSINFSRLELAATYILCMPLFTVCIMSLVHALCCATRNTTHS